MIDKYTELRQLVSLFLHVNVTVDKSVMLSFSGSYLMIGNKLYVPENFVAVPDHFSIMHLPENSCRLIDCDYPGYNYTLEINVKTVYNSSFKYVFDRLVGNDWIIETLSETTDIDNILK